MASVLLFKCPHCGIDLERIIDARNTVATAVRFLRGDDGKSRAVTPSLEYESGVLDALEWALGTNPPVSISFDKHLDALARIREEMEAACRP